MISIRKITGPLNEEMSGLVELLIDAVADGASVGFLAPLQEAVANAYWTNVSVSIGPGLALWIAEHDGRIVGAVQLAPCTKENGLHRAEIQKLFVHTTHRGQHIATRLMHAAEQFATSTGRSLLLLDTEAGSQAEAVYRHMGWTRVGEIPRYAKSPDGSLHATAYYYKSLTE